MSKGTSAYISVRCKNKMIKIITYVMKINIDNYHRRHFGCNYFFFVFWQSVKYQLLMFIINQREPGTESVSQFIIFQTWYINKRVTQGILSTETVKKNFNGVLEPIDCARTF